MRILLYSNRKMEPIAFDASTPELEAAAFLKLFRFFDHDQEGGYNMYDGGRGLPGSQGTLYQKAKVGDSTAARKLLTARMRYEYEQWSLIDVMSPYIAKLDF